MPEAGYLPIPKKLAQAGVKDMLRLSDARMSGTAFGSVILHVAPEAAVGGPLAAVRDGDRIRLSVRNRSVELLVDDEEIQKRLANLSPPAAARRGYKALYQRCVSQAPEGCDFDFLADVP
jgi:dihydroxy-acid dehydratase